MVRYPNTSLLDIINLSIGYRENLLIHNIDLRLKAGETMSIIGESGSGKSTFLKTIAGRIQPLEGEILIRGIKLTKNLNLTYAHPSIVYLDQTFTLLENTPILNNLTKELRDLNDDDRRERVKELVKLFALNELVNKLPKELSIGQQQRVALATAFAKPAELLLLDEPFSHQDELHKPILIQACKQLLKKHKTALLLVSHQIVDSMQLTDRVAWLNPPKLWIGLWNMAHKIKSPFMVSLFYTIAYQILGDTIRYYKVGKRSKKSSKVYLTAFTEPITLDSNLYQNSYKSLTDIILCIREPYASLVGTKKLFYLELLPADSLK